MKVMFDLNVIVDIAEERTGFCEKSREAFERAVQLGVHIYFPIHGFTTLHYLLAHAGKGEDSKAYISWLCDHVECAPADKSIVKLACASSVRDFEDAVVDETAFAAKCECIVTRNARHFASSRVKALSPEAFLSLLSRRIPRRRQPR